MRNFLKSPEQIEAQSMNIIARLLGNKSFPAGQEKIIKRIIHTTADLDFAEITAFSPKAIEHARQALLQGNCLLTADTQMIVAGVNKTLLNIFGSSLDCFVGEEKVRKMAKAEAITRSMANIRYAARHNKEGIYIIGNAPTALYELLCLAEKQIICPSLVIGVPVGFVGAQEAKEALMQSNLPYISTRGRKGGSTVAVAIVHALLHLFLAERNRKTTPGAK